MRICRQYKFDSAHRLPFVPEGHKCSRLHGHTYILEVFVEGEINNKGWVMDFSDIDVVVKPIIKQLDHYYLNEISGLENPTSENIAVWIKTRLPDTRFGVRLWEGTKSYVET